MNNILRLALLGAVLLVSSSANAVSAQTESPLAKQHRLFNKANMLLEDALDQSDNRVAIQLLQESEALLLQARAVRDDSTTQAVRDTIEEVRAQILWYRGRMADDRRDYWGAVQLLDEAVKKYPRAFKNTEDQAYKSAVMQRHLRSLPNRTRIVNPDDPTMILTDAISTRVFHDATPEVTARVLSAFQAAIAGNWSAVSGSFRQAATLAPNDPKLRRLLALAESAPLRAERGLKVDSGVSTTGTPLPMVFDVPALKTHMSYMQNPAIMKALEDILLVLYRDAGR